VVNSRPLPQWHQTAELLAPAGTRRMGEIAVNAGADAVYIGAGRFSARRRAGNELEDIAQLARYAHRYRAKVYGAVNTLVNDKERPAAVQLIHQLVDAGVDGIILADPELLHESLPSVPLIASTQMHNIDAAQVQRLERAGFSRAILARELDIEDIRRIRAATRMELEVFVHGALCTAYGGCCDLSRHKGGRSADRRNCAQPCRLRYRLEDHSGQVFASGHLLSLRDLCRIDQIGPLLDAGVNSFKIEGRLKDEIYVANVVLAYRRVLDAALAERKMRGSTDRITAGFVPDLRKSFQRGYVAGFARGNESMAAFRSPKNIGETVGTVLRSAGRTLMLHGGSDLCPGDGLCWFNGDVLEGSFVARVDGDSVETSTGAPQEGTVVYRNRDLAFFNAVRRGPPVRRVPVTMTVRRCADGVELVIADAAGGCAVATLDGPLPVSVDPVANEARWRTQLQKTGDVEFVCDHVTVEGALPAAKVAAMNDLRRRACGALRELRENRRLTAPPARPSVELAERQLHRPGRVMLSKYCLRRELSACLRTPSGRTLPDGLVLVDDQGCRWGLRFDCDACEMSICVLSPDADSE